MSAPAQFQIINPFDNGLNADGSDNLETPLADRRFGFTFLAQLPVNTARCVITDGIEWFSLMDKVTNPSGAPVWGLPKGRGVVNDTQWSRTLGVPGTVGSSFQRVQRMTTISVHSNNNGHASSSTTNSSHQTNFTLDNVTDEMIVYRMELAMARETQGAIMCGGVPENHPKISFIVFRFTPMSDASCNISVELTTVDPKNFEGMQAQRKKMQKTSIICMVTICCICPGAMIFSQLPPQKTARDFQDLEKNTAWTLWTLLASVFTRVDMSKVTGLAPVTAQPQAQANPAVTAAHAQDSVDAQAEIAALKQRLAEQEELAKLRAQVASSDSTPTLAADAPPPAYDGNGGPKAA